MRFVWRENLVSRREGGREGGRERTLNENGSTFPFILASLHKQKQRNAVLMISPVALHPSLPPSLPPSLLPSLPPYLDHAPRRDQGTARQHVQPGIV